MSASPVRASPAGEASAAGAPAGRRGWWAVGAVVLVAAVVWRLTPIVETALKTVSTDDAYVNGHATFVAPRVAGQVLRVLVDDNYHVKAGDVLVEIDPEPFQVQVDLQSARVTVAKANLIAAQSQVRSLFAQARSARWKIETTIQAVDDQIASLHANVATLHSRQATRDRAQADFKRAAELVKTAAISPQDFDSYREALAVAEAQVNEALETVYETRASLGVPRQPPVGAELTDTPADLNQTFSTVRQAVADLADKLTLVGLPLVRSDMTPAQMLAEFAQHDPAGNVDHLAESLLPEAPAVKQAEALLRQAEQDLVQARLDLSYCTVVAPIDGVVTRRNVNPGNYVQVGQQLMATASLTEIWIDCNFKETQLAALRIGQRVDLYTDAYGGRRAFSGRITGFTYGTGSTLALLPPQNATGNFVKVVQRLPVRVELNDYDPNTDTLFAGLSVEPYVYIYEPATGPNAGRRLQQAIAPGGTR